MLKVWRTMGWATLLVASFATPATVNAQSTAPVQCPAGRAGCSASDLDFRWSQSAFQDIAFDTGFVPSGSPAQVRFGVRVRGTTAVELGARAETSWPDALTATLPGIAQTGRLSMGYGAEIIARLKIDTRILGRHIQWEGDLPFISLPSDLMLEKTTTFDPFAFGGAPVTASDTTERIRAFSYDVLGTLIPIPGIEGSLSLDVQGELETSYRTTQIAIGASGMMNDHGAQVQLPATGADGYGPSHEYAVRPEGTVSYRGGFRLFPVLTVKILGITLLERDLGELPLSFNIGSSTVKFKERTVHVPLPDVRVSETSVRLTPSMTSPVTFTNAGEAPLTVRATAWPTQLAGTAPSFTVAPGATHTLNVSLATGARDAAASIAFATNDPDRATLTLPLTVTGAGTGTGSGTMGTGTTTGSGTMGTGPTTGTNTTGTGPTATDPSGEGRQVGGCSTTDTSATSLAWLAIGLVLFFPRRRARRA